MKLIIIILLCVILLSGCAEPLPASQPTQKEDCSTLQAEYDVLQFNYDSLKRASEGTKDANEKYNAQVNELQVLRIENAALKGQLQILTGQYNAALNALTGSQADAMKALEEMNSQIEKMTSQFEAEQARNRAINEQVRKVMEKKVTLLSDNLTDIEYNAFYKGWELWWWTFNEKDEEE